MTVLYLRIISKKKPYCRHKLISMCDLSLDETINSDLPCSVVAELLRAPFKAGKLPNGGVGLLVHYNNEDILVSAEVSDSYSHV